jgi:flagellar motor switch protein FliG
MSAEHSTSEPRVLGNREGMGEGTVEIAAWQPPTPAEVAARPPLPAPPPRPQRVVAGSPGDDDAAGAAHPETEGETSTPKPAPPTQVERPSWVEDGSVQALAWERAQDTARWMRTTMVQAGKSQEASTLAPMQRIAIVCVGLGQEICGEVFKFCSDYEIEEFTRAVAGLKGVSVEMQNEVLAEFEQHLLAGQYLKQGGMHFARAALERAVGPRKAQEFLDRIASTVTSGFYALKNVAPEQVAPFISHEHPQTIALLLSQLNVTQGAGILQLLPEPIQKDVAYRIAMLENVTPAVLKALEESIEGSLRDLIVGNQDVGGPKVLADLINLTGSSMEKSLLDDLDGRDAPLAESVRNLMFVFAEIERLSDADLQLLVAEVDFQDWVVALKAAEESLKEKLRPLMGDERWQQLSQEMEELGPMRLGEVEEVQLRIVQTVRQLEEQGKITIVRGEADDAWV